jgi:hypothetical protein
LIDRPATNDPAREQTGSVVSEHAARRVAALSLAENPAPRAPVTVSVSSTRAALLLDSTIDAEIRSARERFLRNAVSEESFVAEHALLRAAEGEADVVAKAAVNVAIALRAYAQEPVWFPGFTASSADAVAGRNGLQEIRFANAIPDSWQPYYLRMIDLALADLKSVLPGLDLEGLRIEIGYAGIRPGMLALHDPRRNRLILPPETGAGAIAHEIAHHLDGQVASRRYGLRGDYASDGAHRAARDGLATHFVDLAHATDGPRAAGSSSPHASRPAEIFARSVEWFVAEALAGTGRSNGYLTSVQDDMLRGFGSARPLASDGNAAEALTLVLDEVAPLDPMTRYAFLARYGRTTAPEGPHAEPSAPARTLALQPAPGLGTPSTAAVDLPKVTEVPSANRPAPNGRE